MRMIRNIIQILILSVLIFAMLPGCDVHEFPTPVEPEPDGPVYEEIIPAVMVDLNFKRDLPPFMTINYATKSAEEHDIRYQLRVYDETKDAESVGKEIARYTFTAEISEELNYRTVITLPEGSYRLWVWADYVQDGLSTDLYHNTASFGEIKLLDPHTGNTDYRDAFLGSQKVTVGKVEVEQGTEVEPISVKVEMERPLAKYEFITTDLKKFVSQHAADNRQRGAGNTADINDYYVEFSYSGYMPTTFNMFSNKPIDSKSGVSFKSTLTQIDENSASLGFDYVLVNGSESEVLMTLKLYSNDGELLSSATGISVPITRSKVTTMKGEFLTQEATGGVGIDPAYEDEYNIFWDMTIK